MNQVAARAEVERVTPNCFSIEYAKYWPSYKSCPFFYLLPYPFATCLRPLQIFNMCLTNQGMPSKGHPQCPFDFRFVHILLGYKIILMQILYIFCFNYFIKSSHFSQSQLIGALQINSMLDIEICVKCVICVIFLMTSNLG